MSESSLYSSVTTDPATGFLEKNEQFVFGAKGKTTFLKALKRHGNQTAAADEAGVPYESVVEHLRIDNVFSRAFRATMVAMCHTIEGRLYTDALKGETKQATMWLQANFPEIYKPGAARTSKKDTSVIDALYGKIQ